MFWIGTGGPMDWKENGIMLFSMKGCPVIDNSHGDTYLFLDITRAPYHDSVCIGSKHLVILEDILIFVVRKVTIYIMTFLKRIISGFVCSRVRGSLRCYRQVFSSWRAGAHRVSRVEDTCVRWRSVSWSFLRFR